MPELSEKQQTTIDQLIINSPYVEPAKHWKYHPETRTFTREPTRRPAGYVIASSGSQAFDDPGVFIELPMVNQIRQRVKAWRESGYAGVTGITKRLLEHWQDREQRNFPFFFCQLEAIETLIWLTEASPAEKQGIEIEGDGGPFDRLCSKMATGSGKTIVMSMMVAWHILNKVTYPQDKRFSKNVFIVAPGLTVKSRLQVLQTSGPENYYDQFQVVPPGLKDKLRQGRVKIINWHSLQWDTEEKLAKKKSVDKRGAKSDEAYVREVLGEMANAQNILVINDEAHHAWRVPAESKVKGVAKEDIEEATKWVGGLDRIHQTRGILSCYDLSATPFSPSGKKAGEEALFTWIVSDFGLNDAIESGLVKTPRVVVRDEGKRGPDYKSRFYHIYRDPDVQTDFNRRARPNEPLPGLVTTAYYHLGLDWRETAKVWEELGFKTPPVMITVANRTETAARIKHAFDTEKILIKELSNPERTLHIDSKVLDKAESQEEPVDLEDDETGEDEDQTKKLTKAEQAEQLRQMVDTVGHPGKPGEMIQNVISVGMLSEGWDARTVTHIMGLRAFSSQLLCEQVVGRGLRRTSYEVDEETGLYQAEYVNIFGVPFTFLPHEGGGDTPPPPPKPKTRIEPVAEKREFEITWPNIIRIDHVYKPRLTLDIKKVKLFELNAYETPLLCELAPVVSGKPDFTKLTEIDLEKLGREQRLQRVIFQTAVEVYEQMKPDWKGNREYLLGQLIRVVEEFIDSGRLSFSPALFYQDPIKKRILLTLNLTKLVHHIWEAIRFENAETRVPVFDTERPIRSTGDMQPWYTGKPWEYAEKSHINLCVCDSAWEATEAFRIAKNKNVEAWVKNDHLGFEILYIYGGVVQKYRPDFLIRLKNGVMMVLEVKGQDSTREQTKRRFLDEWVQAVNQHSGFGKWAWDVSFTPSDVEDKIEKACATGRV